MRDLGNYLVILKQNFQLKPEFFRNRKAKLISDRELIFYDSLHINSFALAFLLNLGMPFQNSVRVTFVGSALEITQFYLSSTSQAFQKYEEGTKIPFFEI